MKLHINFLLLVLAAVVVSTIYGLLTFQVDEPQPFVFNEPKLPPEFLLQDEAIQNNGENQTKIAAVEDAQKALTIYKDYQKNAPQQANDTIALLVERMTNSDLPLYFLSSPNTQQGSVRKFETLTINTNSIIDPTTAKQNFNCSSKAPVANIIIGTSGKDMIVCDTMRDITGTVVEPDFMFMGGPDDDQITDALGNRIVNGGTGNDTLKLAAGRSIIVLDASWGHDKVDINCAGAMIIPSEIPANFSIPWVHKTTNFIVLGSSINPADVAWKGNVLTHNITGDTLAVNQNCFNVVPAIQ